MIFGRIKLWLLGAFGFLVALLFAFLKGRSVQASKEEQKNLKNYNQTRKRIDEATSVDRDVAAARKWLRDRN